MLERLLSFAYAVFDFSSFEFFDKYLLCLEELLFDCIIKAEASDPFALSDFYFKVEFFEI